MAQEPENQRDAEPAEFTPAHAIAWFMGAFALLVAAAGVLFATAPHKATDIVTLGGLSGVVFLFVSALLLGKYPGGPSASLALGARATQPLLVPLGFLLGVVSQFPADRLRRVIEAYFPLSADEITAREHLLDPTSVAHGALIVLVVALLVPVAEEAFFRGAVFGALRRSGRSGTLAAIVTSLGFTLSHFDQRMWLPIAFVASLLGFVRAASGSLLPGLALHVGFNGLSALAAVSGLSSPEAEELPLKFELVTWGLLALFVVAFALLSRGRRAWVARRAEETRFA